MLRSLGKLLACLALCLGVGYVGGMATEPEIQTWYASLAKPSWTPPNWVFPVVWTALYAMMGVSLWLFWDRGHDGMRTRNAVALFVLQLLLNAAWTGVFFVLHEPAAALVTIVLLSIAVAATIQSGWRVHKAGSALLVPYLAWLIYATSLNAGVVILNK